MTKEDPESSGTFVTRVLQAALGARGFQFVAAAFAIAVLAALLPRLGTPLLTVALGASALVFLAIIYVIFSWLLNARASHRSKLSLTLAYTVTGVATAGTLLLFASTFFNWPLPIKALIAAKMDLPRKFDIREIFSQLKVGSSIASAEAIIGPPFYYDESIRRYKLRDGALEVILVPRGGMIEASYVEWVLPPTPPLPIVDSPSWHGDFPDDYLQLGKSTFGNFLDALPLECGAVHGDSYQSVYYAATDCRLETFGGRDPYFISLGANSAQKLPKQYHELESVEEIRDVVVDFISITQTEGEGANPVMSAQDLRAYGGG